VLADTRTQVGRGAVRLLAALVLVPALVLGVMAARGAQDPLRPFDIASSGSADPLPWQTVSGSAGFEAALSATDGPSVIYLTADWCITCRTIDRRVLSDADVVDALSAMNRIKVDLTAFDSDDQALLALLGAAGPPTMIFLDAGRHELPETRLVGETRIAPVLQSARQVAP
jgi:thiol:disulfide interchange protein DsbD